MDETQNSAQAESKEAKIKTSTAAEIARYLDLIPTDTVEIPTPPNVAEMPPLAAARAMASYHRELAKKLSAKGSDRKIRTRAMIILGSLVSTIESETLRASIRNHVAEVAAARDLEVAAEIIPWLVQKQEKQS